MTSSFILSVVLAGNPAVGNVRADPPADRYYRVDLAPVGNLCKQRVSHRIIFVGKSAKDTRIDFSARFKPDQTLTEIRDEVFQAIERTALKVKKVGDTELVIYGCKTLTLTTEMPPAREFPLECRPKLDVFDNEKDALKRKD